MLTENPKGPTQKLLDLSEFRKVAGYNTNIQISVAFLHTNNEISERECKKQHQTFMVAQWLGIHLPMQRTQARSLVQEDSTCHRAAEPM